jgi:CubicO group peptidase (beta-lactamase class C family)
MATEIHGYVAPGFAAVKAAFARNFERDDAYRELGASLAVYRAGELVVALHGGFRDQAHTTPWTSDTLANIWSATKGIAAIEVAALVGRGKLRYEALVTDYWPEYGQNGKAETTVAQLMSHQAGLPGFVEPTPLADFYDWNVVTARLARQAPMWKPGTKNSYHAMTYGFLAGELVRRGSGLGVGAFLREAIAAPLGADVFIGLPESEEHRVAPLVPSPLQQAFDPIRMPPEAVIAVSNPDMAPTLPNDRAWRAAQIPAGNGHASALGLAKIYGAVANGGTLDGVRIVNSDAIEQMSKLQTDRPDILLGAPAYWRNGMHGNIGGMFGPHRETIGHSGWGGSFGCFNAEHGIGIGYVLNQMGDHTVGDPRATALCAAIFEASNA